MDFFRALVDQAVQIPGPAIERIGAAARAVQAVVVMGMTERDGGSLYNTQAFFGADGTLLGSRRKLKPTSAERLVWGEGDGSGLRVFESNMDGLSMKLGGLMCGEHNFALARYTLQALGEQIHVASYPDPLMEGRPFTDRVEAAVRHYAAEGQCFVLNANGLISDEIRARAFDTPEALAEISGADARSGGSWHSGARRPRARRAADWPRGAYFARVLTSAISLMPSTGSIAAGHSGRGDVFKLTVDFRAAYGLCRAQGGAGWRTTRSARIGPV